MITDEKLFFIPKDLKDYPSLTFPSFGNDHPIAIEFCAGNGTWIARKGLEIPAINWVAVDLDIGRVKKILTKINNHKIPNLLAVCAKAEIFSEYYIPKESISEVYINFPDPWPKRRHAKNRIIKSPFLSQIASILKPEGKVTFVTDDQTYLLEAIKIFSKEPAFQFCDPAPATSNA